MSIIGQEQRSQKLSKRRFSDLNFYSALNLTLKSGVEKTV